MSYTRPRPRTKYVGVYAIRHLPTGKMYVGGSTDITGRYTHHRFMLRRGCHKTVALQKLWEADGEQAFEFFILEHCSRDELLEREDQWIKKAGYLNTAPGAVPSRFAVSTPAKKQAALKRWANPAYRAKQQRSQKIRSIRKLAKDKPPSHFLIQTSSASSEE